ncbi:exodeoxyribonuclease V subunit alpha [Luteimonas granuli]|uniref:RecBCD enzyme subunit RecD n=1 Tax=Luteimonas granuli TaxID=1176533 RepID=A0A518N497_9GAMM|nr:exodeoxyribonuclease V subunit alpha [Luteimonas granuli]QDW66697.1 exodeoxyribonuclease V subunit alpha [Luteimonas granuli]
MSLLQALVRARALRPLDHALAQSLRRLDPDTPDAVLAAAALASLAVAEGHAGFDPAEPQRLMDAPIAWPDIDTWRRALGASRWVACPERGDAESAPDAPLVFEHGLVYLRRYREYERRLADGLRRIGHAPPQHGAAGAAGSAGSAGSAGAGAGAALADSDDAPAPADGDDAHVPASLAPLFARLFPEAATSDDPQSRAAAAALRHRLLLVTGGPGTGKTTTITRVLVLLVAQAIESGHPPPRIALAAPTGRAAERMAESVRHAVQALTALGVDAELCARLPTTGTTLHRLLGTLPDSPRFRHHADNPLPFDVVVVDEASMIDLPLMAKLVEAVHAGARLVLLGDPDQLPSVEAGDVLAGILRAAEARATAASFPARHIHLTRGWRQSAALDLAPLAAAVREGDADTALSLLRGGGLSGVHFHEGNVDPLQTHREQLLAHWASLAEARDPAEALARAGRMRVLTAVREGPQGARGLNARIEEMLAGARRGAGPASAAGRYFHGRLLLVTENSYRHRLFNGDIGICLRDDSGTLMAWFPGDDPGNPRPFHPAALPAHDSAFAMTVHKAQGSEFDEVWLVLPERFNRVWSRELVYTGLTRARRMLNVGAGESVIRGMLSNHASRWSGLGRRLSQ